MPKGNRKPRRRPPFQFQLALIGDRLRQIQKTGRLTISFEWERKVSHEQTVCAFTLLDKDLRYRLDRLDQFEKEHQVREMLICKKAHKVRTQSAPYISRATGVSLHRVKEIRHVVYREARGESPLDLVDGLVMSLDKLAEFQGFAVIPAPQSSKK